MYTIEQLVRARILEVVDGPVRVGTYYDHRDRDSALVYFEGDVVDSDMLDDEGEVAFATRSTSGVARHCSAPSDAAVFTAYGVVLHELTDL